MPVASAQQHEATQPAQFVQFKNEGFAWAVGDFALSQGKQVWSGRGDDERYKHKHSVRGLIANVSTWIQDSEFGLVVTTGLPADLYVRYPNLKSEIKASLDGTYEFTTDGMTWRKCTIEIASVIMEGTGALLAHQNQHGARLTKTTEAGVIDIGGGTVDLFAQRGANAIAEYCGSERHAVEQAASYMRQLFLKKYPNRSLTDTEVREILYAFANGRAADFPTISVYGQQVAVTELQDMIEEAINNVADDIVTFVSSKWREADAGARFNPIIVVGGGYYYFLDAIVKRIPHVFIFDEEKDALFPVFANVIGYAILAFKKLQNKLEAMKAEAASKIVESEIVESKVIEEGAAHHDEASTMQAPEEQEEQVRLAAIAQAQHRSN
jgi:hypothetical protein